MTGQLVLLMLATASRLSDVLRMEACSMSVMWSVSLNKDLQFIPKK